MDPTKLIKEYLDLIPSPFMDMVISVFYFLFLEPILPVTYVFITSLVKSNF